jgi:hypothetical protein
MVRAWHGRGMASVNQTWSHCVNQVGKTHSKPLAARHGRGTAWARHVMCECAFKQTLNTQVPNPCRRQSLSDRQVAVVLVCTIKKVELIFEMRVTSDSLTGPSIYPLRFLQSVIPNLTSLQTCLSYHSITVNHYIHSCGARKFINVITKACHCSGLWDS